MLSVGQRVAGYRIEAVLGRGGMGVVYEATQVALERAVALKVLPLELSGDAVFRERFRREGVLQAALDHPHIVAVYEAGEADDSLFLAMRLIRGATLAQIIRFGRLDVRRALGLLGAVADALDVAHQAGLVHRDVKPQNVLVDERDHAYLADFGLTRAPESPRLTQTGDFLGTVNYVAPEYIQGQSATAASDIYAFAATLFECLTGGVPYPRQSQADALWAHVEDPIPRVTDLRPELPAALDEVIARGMAKQPEDRYSSAGEIVVQTRKALDAGTTGASLPRLRERGAVSRGLPTPTKDPDRERSLAPPSAVGELAAGTVLGDYEIEGVAGRGGMGVVYRARDRHLGRRVALKVIAPAIARDPIFRARFRREALVAASIQHPNVLPVYGSGEDGERVFIAMRFVDGTDLRTQVQTGGPLGPADAIGVIDQVAAALDAAHARGLVHRDVKPANVLLAGTPVGEQVYLSDFGLCAPGDAEVGLTRTGQWVGTPAYAAPEQLRGEQTDARTDIYALGGVLHTCLTGQLPYPLNDVQILAAHLNAPPPRPSTLMPGLPRALDDVVARAMSKRPSERFPTAGALASAARTAASRRHSDIYGQLRWRIRRRTRRLARIAAPLVLAVAGAVVFSAALDRRPSGESRSTRLGPPIALGTTPDYLTTLDDSLWALSDAGDLVRLGRSGKPRSFDAPVGAGVETWADISRGFGSLWLLRREGGGSNVGRGMSVDRVDPANGALVGRVPLADGRSLAIGAGAVWIVAPPDRRDRGSRLMRVEPGTLGVRTIELPRVLTPSDVAVAAGSVWVSDSRADSLVRVDARNLRIRARILVGDDPRLVAASSDGVWVASRGDLALTRVDPAGNSVARAPAGGVAVDAMVLADRTLWVAAANGTVIGLDASDGRVRTGPISGGRAPLRLAWDGRRLAVASVPDGTVRYQQPGRR